MISIPYTPSFVNLNRLSPVCLCRCLQSVFALTMTFLVPIPAVLLSYGVLECAVVAGVMVVLYISFGMADASMILGIVNHNHALLRNVIGAMVSGRGVRLGVSCAFLSLDPCFASPDARASACQQHKQDGDAEGRAGGTTIRPSASGGLSVQVRPTDV